MQKSTRVTIALVLQVVAVLFSLMTWVDPLEGGVAMVMSIGWTAIAYLVGRIPLPKFTWITSLVGIAYLVAFWAIYIAEAPTEPSQVGTYEPSSLIMTLVWIWNVVAVAFIASSVLYAVVQFTSRRALRAAGDN
jgi:uncharacterized membrane protein HdeD (DUF308 family)